jgi:hypothetical protein
MIVPSFNTRAVQSQGKMLSYQKFHIAPQQSTLVRNDTKTANIGISPIKQAIAAQQYDRSLACYEAKLLSTPSKYNMNP